MKVNSNVNFTSKMVSHSFKAWPDSNEFAINFVPWPNDNLAPVRLLITCLH